MKKKIFINILILILSTIPWANAQKHINFETLSLEDGLSQSSVNCILQDSQGFMWFGTLDGLNRYDGYQVMVYRNNPEDSTSIADNAISCLYQDQQDRLWIGITNGGLSRYDKINEIFINYTFEPENNYSISTNDVHSIAEDNNGTLWIATSEGLNCFDQAKQGFHHFKNGDKPADNRINQIKKGKNGLLWLATDGGLFSFNPNNKKFKAIKPENNEQLMQIALNTIFIDKGKSIWCGSDQGLFIYDISNGNAKHFRHNAHKKTSLSHNTVTAITRDSSGVLWIGTEKGLNRYNRRDSSFTAWYSDLSQPGSLSVNHILSLYSDESNILWVGTSLGGVNKWNRAAKQFRVIENNPSNKYSLSSNKVRTFYQSHDSIIWVGTVDGGLNKWLVHKDKFIAYTHNPDDETTISHNHARSIAKDKYGKLWIGTDGGGLNRFDPQTGKFQRFYHNEKNPHSISHNRIWEIYIDSKDNLWIGTFGGGLDRLKLDEAKKQGFKNLTFQHFSKDSANAHSISGNYITSMLEDHTGKLWIGTYYHGLNLFQYQSESFKHFQQKAYIEDQEDFDRVYALKEDKDGTLWVGTRGSLNRLNRKTMTFDYYNHDNYDFPNHVLMSVLDDSHGNIWVATNRGIAKFFPENDSVRNYTVSDGLQSNEFMIGAALKTRSGRMLFGGQTGFNAFYPEKIKDNPHIPEIVLTGFQIFHKYVKLDTAISEKNCIQLSYDQNNFTFEFVAIDYVFSQQNQYAYIMEGFDEEMNYVGNRRYATYTNLPPGKYTFKVIGSNNDGKWNQTGESIQIIIEPPFWMRTWFIISVLVALLGIIYFIIRVRDVYRDKSELERTVQERTREIMKQKEDILEKNEELRQQQEEILTQRDEIERQRDYANDQKEALTDSITYAQRIQSAILPPSDNIKQIVPNHFILYKPRDIVSGDYYWLTQKNDKIIIVAADCTGHGVPGAFLSILGVSFLNEIVNTIDTILANEIVNRLRNYVMNSLHQTGKDNEAKDGMDLALCVIDKKTLELQYSGAYNPLYLIRKIKNNHTETIQVESINPKKEIKKQKLRTQEQGNYQLIEIKADRMPVSISDIDDSFTNHITRLKKGDSIYMFSDGYADQFGGPQNKKFKSKAFKKLLLSIQEKNMDEQKHLLDNSIEQWKGENEQLDDILVMGIRF